MTEKLFSFEARDRANAIWEAIVKHPFVQGIGKGDLPEDKYVFYLKQDYLYLLESSRLFGVASAKSDLLKDKAFFANLLQTELNIEMEMHRKICEDYGIKETDLEKTRPSLITTAFANHLVRHCYEGGLREILAVLLPCASGYIEIARRLKDAHGLPENPHYKAWIQTYCSDELKVCEDVIGGRLNDLTQEVSTPERNKLLELYLTSARFELLFFDMAWNKAEWPEIAPM